MREFVRLARGVRFTVLKKTCCKKNMVGLHLNYWERSSVWLERMPVTHEVASSSLVVPAIKRSHLVWLFLMAELIVVRIAFCELREGAEAGAFLRLC